MSTELTVLPAGRSIEELAATANREHAATRNALHDALQHALRVGEAIHELHETIGLPDWAEWCSGHLTFAITEASRYERLFCYQDYLPEEALQPYTDAQGLVRPRIRARRRGGVAGGHAWKVDGYNQTTGVYRMKNSWGTGWGLNGYAHLSKTTLEQLVFGGQGEAAIGVEA